MDQFEFADNVLSVDDLELFEVAGVIHHYCFVLEPAIHAVSYHYHGAYSLSRV